MGFAFWLRERDGNDRDVPAPAEHRSRRPGPSAESLSTASLEDAQLLARIREGEIAAFESIYRTYHAELCDYAAALMGSRAIGDELVADMFLAIWQRRAVWNPEHGIAAYLFRAIRNRAANARRHAVREDTRHHSITEEDEQLVPPTDLESYDRAVILGRIISALTPERRVLIQLRWGRGLSYAEIASRLGVSTAAVQMQMSRLLRVLRQRLPEDFR